MTIEQITFSDNIEFGEEDPFAIPQHLWSVKTKTPEALRLAQCVLCGKKPESIPPTPKGWMWDTMEPDAWYMYCPECVQKMEDEVNNDD